MPRRPLQILILLSLTTGCAQPEVQPKRTLRELYEVQAEVEKTAEPYDMGTGSNLGRYNYERSTGDK